MTNLQEGRRFAGATGGTRRRKTTRKKKGTARRKTTRKKMTRKAKARV